MEWLVTDNLKGRVKLADIPLMDYAGFYLGLVAYLGEPACHVANYFAVPSGERLVFYCLLLDDAAARVLIASHAVEYYDEQGLESVAAVHPQMHVFEREITERFGVQFNQSPWKKPLRYPFNRVDGASNLNNYPFYHMEGESLHEVNVGPIHAGIIEPGAFRFICNGETVLHLEIALGYQHRGVESLICETGNRLRQSLLAESIAGDSVVAHTTAYAMTMERLSGKKINGELETERLIALELERIAMHIADASALCADVAYQLGQVACEALRTIVINSTQLWCGNRFGKGMIRPGGTFYPLKAPLVEKIMENLTDVKKRFAQVREDLKSTPTVLARFEECGVVSQGQMLTIGAVGVTARASGLARDVRATHPWYEIENMPAHQIATKEFGDVMARLMTRCSEALQSIGTVLALLADYRVRQEPSPLPDYTLRIGKSCLAFCLLEGWRGEICHTAVTDGTGALVAYKIKDPSMHNWMALALSVRGGGISDFPICNKSFNLSYAGHDL